MNYLAPLLYPLLKPDWAVSHDVSYGPDPQHLADTYLLNKPGLHPVMMFIHGGGWSSGDKAAYAGRAAKYALAGFHVVSVNYRLATFDDPLTHWPAQYADVSRAMGWCRKTISDHICVGGDSAGGHLALMLGTSPDRPHRILNMFGPTDLSVLSSLICTLPLFGGKPADKTACPVELMDAKFPPTVTMHGTSDATVPYSQAVELDQKLAELGVVHKLVTFDGGHEFANLPWWRQELLEMRGLWWMMG